MSLPPKFTQVIGDYFVGETVGKGSFGKVKKGIHVPTGEHVAIKILNRQKLKSANMDKKIIREIRILKLFRHPNICRLYEVISTPADIFLIMEFVDGGELYDFIVKQGRLGEDSARYVFQQIVCALEYCHHFRVVHRDLKPENILLSANLQVKLIDFGLSNIMRDGDFLATSCGSPNYAAPEVISGKLYAGPEVDVWSCGVVLYALLCGCLPFDEETIPLLFAKIKKGKFVIPGHVNPKARALLENLLVVDPLARLTIPQIRDLDWFATSLPFHLRLNEDQMEKERISYTTVRLAAEKARITVEQVETEIAAGSGRGFVAYNIILDARRSKEIATIGEKIQQHTVDPELVTLTASQKELNLGLLLTISPAMEALLDISNAQANKVAYNTASFVPASVRQTRDSGVTPSPSNGAFVVSTTPSTAALDPRAGSLQRMSLTNNSSLKGGSGVSSATSGGEQGRSRTGTVHKAAAAYSAQEEYFALQHNVGWRIGLMTEMQGMAAMGIIYDVLRNRGFEWKVSAPFRILIRRSGVHPPPVVLSLYVFRMQEKHDKGYICDFGIIRGNTIEAMDVIFELATLLNKRIG